MEGTGRAAVAEFVGAFAVVLFGAGAVLYGADLVGVALAQGLTLGVMTLAAVHLSGGAFNPALQAALWVIGRATGSRAVCLAAAQLAGAVAAALVLRWVAGPVFDGFGGISPATPAVAPGLSPGKAACVEALATFVLVWVYVATIVDDRSHATVVGAPAVGLTLAGATLAIFALTGAALNPARWFGPALVAGDWTNWWVWIVGPAAGAIVAAVTYWTVFLRRGGPTTP